MNWLILFLGILSNAFASTLIKIAVTNANPTSFINNPLAIFSNIHLIFGVSLYVIALVFYSLSLSYLPLNMAHPILTGGSIALVSIISFLYFREGITTFYFVGILFIIVGIFFLTVD